MPLCTTPAQSGISTGNQAFAQDLQAILAALTGAAGDVQATVEGTVAGAVTGQNSDNSEQNGSRIDDTGVEKLPSEKRQSKKSTTAAAAAAFLFPSAPLPIPPPVPAEVAARGFDMPLDVGGAESTEPAVSPVSAENSPPSDSTASMPTPSVAWQAAVAVNNDGATTAEVGASINAIPNVPRAVKRNPAQRDSPEDVADLTGQRIADQDQSPMSPMVSPQQADPTPRQVPAETAASVSDKPVPSVSAPRLPEATSAPKGEAQANMPPNAPTDGSAEPPRAAPTARPSRGESMSVRQSRSSAEPATQPVPTQAATFFVTQQPELRLNVVQAASSTPGEGKVAAPDVAPTEVRVPGSWPDGAFLPKPDNSAAASPTFTQSVSAPSLLQKDAQPEPVRFTEALASRDGNNEFAAAVPVQPPPVLPPTQEERQREAPPPTTQAQATVAAPALKPDARTAQPDVNAQPHDAQESPSTPKREARPEVPASEAARSTTHFADAAIDGTIRTGRARAAYARGDSPTTFVSSDPATRVSSTTTASSARNAEAPTSTTLDRVMAATQAAESHTPAQVITVRLNGPEPVDLRFVHRNGETQMSVRSENADMTQQLQANLPELQQNLDKRGFQFEPNMRDGRNPERHVFDTDEQQQRRPRQRPNEEQQNQDD